MADEDPGRPDNPVAQVLAAVEEADHARDDAQAAEAGAREAEASAREAEHEVHETEREVQAVERKVHETEREVAAMEREVRAENPDPQFGRLGRPLRRDSPFMLGFLGAMGVFAAYFLTQAVAQARSVIVLIAVALFLAIGLNPAVEWLTARGMRRGFAVGVVFIVVIGAFVGFGFAVVPPLVEQSNTFAKDLPGYLDELRRNGTVRRLDNQYDIIAKAQDYVNSGKLGVRLFGGIVGVGRIVVSTLFSALSLLIMTLYFLAALPSMKRQAYRLVPATRRERVTLLTDEVLVRIGGFVSGALSVAFIAGVSSYILLSVLGLPYALALAVLVAILDLVPLVGATICAVAVSAIAFTSSTVAGVTCIVFYIAYQQLENYVIYPRVMRRAVDVPAPVTVVAVLLGGALLGVVGALLAIPVAAAVLLVLRQVAIPRMDRV